VVLQLHSYNKPSETLDKLSVVQESLGLVGSKEIEEPPAKAWWCQCRSGWRVVAKKLKNHRLKPGGVKSEICDLRFEII
jgi:hypothetical protein